MEFRAYAESQAPCHEAPCCRHQSQRRCLRRLRDLRSEISERDEQHSDVLKMTINQNLHYTNSGRKRKPRQQEIHQTRK